MIDIKDVLMTHVVAATLIAGSVAGAHRDSLRLLERLGGASSPRKLTPGIVLYGQPEQSRCPTGPAKTLRGTDA